MAGRQKWAMGCLIAYLLALGVIVLTPISYGAVVLAIRDRIHAATGASFGAGWVEFAGNVILFLPLGFLLTLLFRHAWRGTVLAILLSVAVELAQIVIPDRTPSLRDVAANALGAVVGAAAAWLLVLRRERGRTAGRSGTE